MNSQRKGSSAGRTVDNKGDLDEQLAGALEAVHRFNEGYAKLIDNVQALADRISALMAVDIAHSKELTAHLELITEIQASLTRPKKPISATPHEVLAGSLGSIEGAAAAGGDLRDAVVLLTKTVELIRERLAAVEARS